MSGKQSKGSKGKGKEGEPKGAVSNILNSIQNALSIE